MSENTKDCLSWLENEIDDDYVAHLEGNTIEYVPEAAKSAVVKAFMRALHNLPTEDRTGTQGTHSPSSSGWRGLEEPLEGQGQGWTVRDPT